MWVCTHTHTHTDRKRFFYSSNSRLLIPTTFFPPLSASFDPPFTLSVNKHLSNAQTLREREMMERRKIPHSIHDAISVGFIFFSNITLSSLR